MGILKNILVPTDFSQAFKQTLDYAVEIAKPAEAILHIIHVIEPIAFASDLATNKFEINRFTNELELHVKKHIEKIKKMIKEDELTIKTSILHGNAYKEILDYADKNQIDMICIANHAQADLESFLFGSTTKRVLKKAKCPVLTVRINDKVDYPSKVMNYN
jgi:nucleotide-binding universal stress UspA family protein